ncbi:MAG TPA: hypothetical protein VE977_00955 [Pyrinomonadaceae bacterium]|nr:hypothetical protein [Pyrinomonadaceae bacterium]
MGKRSRASCIAISIQQADRAYFNYQSTYNSVWDDEELKDDWNYRTHYASDGSLIEL